MISGRRIRLNKDQETFASAPKIDPRLLELVPHRPPMLLLNEMVAVDDVSSQSLVFINDQTLFFEQGKGVPTWIALEYMGQTAAMIAGYQNLKQSRVSQLGFFLGTRLFEVSHEYFAPESILHVRCREKSLVGETLANFDCSVSLQGSDSVIASATISVFRGLDGSEK